MEIKKAENEKIINLVAIGALLWFVINNCSFYFMASIRRTGVYFELNPYLIHWVSVLVTLTLTVIITRFIVSKLRAQILSGKLNIKKYLLLLGVAIILSEIFNPIYKNWINSTFFNFDSEYVRYYLNSLRALNSKYFTDTIINSVNSIILLVSFIDWKRI